jgi:anti-sigma28 factor (negative regulator of flagellin synthesis)
MGTSNSWIRLDVIAQPGKNNQDPMPKQSIVAKRPISTRRTQHTDGSLTAREHCFRDPLAEALDRAMDLIERRNDRVKRLKEEIDAGRYNVASSELAAHLLHIAWRDFH